MLKMRQSRMRGSEFTNTKNLVTIEREYKEQERPLTSLNGKITFKQK